MTESSQKTNPFLWQRAMFPAIICLCAFVCFAGVYWMCINTIDPIYLLLGLALIIPCLIFFCIAYFAGKNKLSEFKTIFLSVVLIPILFFLSLFYFIIISLSATSVTVSKVSQYERTMHLGGYSTKAQLAVFPEKIPNNVEDVLFYYYEAAWQEYDQTVVLSFSATKEIIDKYTQQFGEAATSIENADSSIAKEIFGRVGEDYIKDLPADYSIYIIINEGNHNRKVCAVSISEKANHIIFYAYEMRW